MDTVRDKALALHASGSNCAQSAYCAFADSLGFDFVEAHRSATGLGAGMGRRQLVCGAVSGAAMALGQALGNDSGADLEAKERCYRVVGSFVERIEREFGSSDCRTLLGIDLSTEEGRAAQKARDPSESVCNRIIARAVELAERAIADEKAR